MIFFLFFLFASPFLLASSETNPCDERPCLNGGLCNQIADNSFSCFCLPGYSGTLCEKSKYCNETKCLNGGFCLETNEHSNCMCFFGYHGERCEEYTNPCDNSPCKNGGSCISSNDSRLGYSCYCPDDYTGTNCSIVKTCQHTGCFNGGICSSFLNSNECLCMEGYTGRLCELKIDMCQQQNPCKNNGTCSYFNNAYYCRCPPFYSGYNCEIELTPCVNSTCKNNATCYMINDKQVCECLLCYYGDECEQKKNSCDPNRCLNGGGCNFDSLTCSEMCSCPNGYSGKYCEIKTRCECLNGGICIQNWLGSYCSCQFGFSGQNCEIKLDECECFNGGSCFEGFCQCPDGYTGKRCELFSWDLSINLLNRNICNDTIPLFCELFINFLVGYRGCEYNFFGNQVGNICPSSCNRCSFSNKSCYDENVLCTYLSPFCGLITTFDQHTCRKSCGICSTINFIN